MRRKEATKCLLPKCKEDRDIRKVIKLSRLTTKKKSQRAETAECRDSHKSMR